MKYLEIDGVRVSAIGLGTWQFGSREWGYGAAYAAHEAPAMVRRALELGITLIDTAEVYGFGESERIVARGLAAAGPELAARAFVATKLLPILPLPSIVASRAAASRDRLEVAAIDLYQLHWPNPIVPVRTQAAGLRRVLDAGIARHVGVSNHGLGRWRALESALRRPIISNQVRFSLATPSPRWDLVPYAAERGRLVIAYSPLGQAFLAADDPAQRRIGTRRMNPLFGDAMLRRARPLLAAVREIAAAHGATPAQVALAWVIAHPNTAAIPGARTLEQLEENAAAADLVLTPDELARLTGESERFDAARRR
jgi:aryl-alcohol dehydrogenase-like predicted oxidoreductase